MVRRIANSARRLLIVEEVAATTNVTIAMRRRERITDLALRVTAAADANEP
jgi:hypothetical protein